MTTFQVVPNSAEPLAPPSAREIEAAIRVTDSDQEFIEFQHKIQAQYEAFTTNPLELLETAGVLFDYLNAAIEKKIVRDAPTGSPSKKTNYKAEQPRVLARAIETVVPLAEFLAKSFESECRGVEKLETLEDVERIGTARDFFCGLFWEELRSVQRCELEPSAPILFALARIMKIEGFNRGFFEEAIREIIRIKDLRSNTVLREKGDLPGEVAYYFMILPALRKHKQFEKFGENLVKFDPRLIAQTFAHQLPQDAGRFIGWATRQNIIDFRMASSRKRIEQMLLNYERLTRIHKSFFISRPLSGPENELEIRRGSSRELSGARRLLDGGSRKRMGEHIGDEGTSPLKPNNADECWALIDEYARDHPGDPVSVFGKHIFSQLEESGKRGTAIVPSVAPLPNKAPELWRARKNRDENPPEFATRVYRVWMDAEVLTRSDLERLDPVLLSKLDNWQVSNRRRASPEPLPEGFKLLTIGQANDIWIERVRRGEAALPTGGEELKRFASALHNRAMADGKREK